ncbi:MAG: hypothetical protein CR982_03050 [Candidatus Cloacimonadota bacterium]|nr:MAG: hypothetical protein CR982_03050 [Candidatus Cloacimonadota bacterium]PIE82042.1 MAG: hypothetical protein CSA15_00240 [Candidatus Delongbacteria bacterium]
MAINSEKKLGKGLGSLFDKQAPTIGGDNGLDENSVVMIDINLIETNPFQPRKSFNQAAINELAISIRENGLIQPINVRKSGDRYQLITGERRLRAVKQIGQKEIKAIILNDFTDSKMMAVAIIENIQRENLNPVDISDSFQQLIDSCGYTQEQVADKVGKSRSSVANFLRLQKLPPRVKNGIVNEEISFGHAKIILSLGSIEKQFTLFEMIKAKNLNIRQTEAMAKQLKFPEMDVKKPAVIDPVFITEQENRISRLIDGRKVRIKLTNEDAGTINIKFSSEEDLRSIITHLKLNG